MRSRYFPYATTPGRLAVQLLSDFAVFVWTAIWLLVGVAVYDAVSTVAEAGRQVEVGARGIAGNLAAAGRGAQHIPLLGDTVSMPLSSASTAALDMAGAGNSLDATASWLAVLLAMAVVAVPILMAATPWVYLRLRFVRRKWAVLALAATPAGEQLLALRALANRPPRVLTAVSADPVGGWRREDPVTIRALAAVELRLAGITIPTR